MIESKMADSVQVEEPQRRAVGGTITTGRIHKGKDVDDQLRDSIVTNIDEN